jgi:putative flippase GtrA
MINRDTGLGDVTLCQFLRGRNHQLRVKFTSGLSGIIMRVILHWHQFGRFLTVGLLALLLRGGVLALLVYVWHVPPLLAIFPAIIATAAVNYLGSAFYVFPNEKDLPSLNIRWRIAAIGIVSIYRGTATPCLFRPGPAHSGRNLLLAIRAAHGSEFLRPSPHGRLVDLARHIDS